MPRFTAKGTARRDRTRLRRARLILQTFFSLTFLMPINRSSCCARLLCLARARQRTDAARCSEFPIFKATIALPPGAKLEYKYVVARVEKTKNGVQSQWEAANRLYTVPQSVPPTAPSPQPSPPLLKPCRRRTSCSPCLTTL